MKLYENPFSVLGASARDSRRQLTERADEAALLGGASVDEALAALMQPHKRIEAELRWFPGTDSQTCASFTAYAQTVSKGSSAAIPPLEGLGCPLAQANALAAFFEAWPHTCAEYLIGLCRSLDSILSKISTEETLAVLNADRQAGGWEPIPDELTLAAPLEDRLRELCQSVTAHLEQIESDQVMASVMNRLFSGAGFDPQGAVGRAMSDAYLLRIHDREESLRQRIGSQLEHCRKESRSILPLDTLKADVEAWCSLTAPVRHAAGPSRRAGQSICHDIRECLVNFVNTAPTKPEKLSKTLPTFNGTRTITVTYQSKAENAEKAIAYSGWLKSQFPEQTELAERLNKDQATLREMISREKANAVHALMQAK